MPLVPNFFVTKERTKKNPGISPSWWSSSLFCIESGSIFLFFLCLDMNNVSLLNLMWCMEYVLQDFFFFRAQKVSNIISLAWCFFTIPFQKRKWGRRKEKKNSPPFAYIFFSGEGDKCEWYGKKKDFFSSGEGGAGLERNRPG